MHSLLTWVRRTCTRTIAERRSAFWCQFRRSHHTVKGCYQLRHPFGQRHITMRTVALLCLMSIACASAQLGSWSDVTKNPAVTPEVKDAANFVLQQANNKDSGLLTAKKGNLSIVRVEDVSTQVVSGINIKMSLLVMDESGQEFEITTVVWSRPWLNGQNTAEPANQVLAFQAIPVTGDTN